MLAQTAQRLTTLSLAVATAAIGFALSQSRVSYRLPTASTVVADSSEDQADDFEVLVQEPSQRRALRPQFGNTMRHANQRSSYFMLRAFRDAIGDSWKGTAELYHDKQRVALGAIVDGNGWILSKASQLPPGGTVQCRFYDGTEIRAELVNRNDELDLALLHVEDNNLPVIQWADSHVPTRGKWVATTDTQSTPTAVGVVSAGIQSVDKRRSVLGVKLTDSDTGGAVISEVMRGTGADAAGLKEGDRISAIDGVNLANLSAALNKLSTCRAGQCVTLAIVRGESKFEALAQLMDLSSDLHDPTEMEVNGLISARSTGFKNVFLHDTVLHPNQCGGPLVDLEGRVVGINIARAGRVTSYALPVSVVRPEVERMLSLAKQKLETPAGTSVSATKTATAPGR